MRSTTHLVGRVKAAELLLVKTVFNENVIVGKPSRDALRWLKAGMEVKACDCEVSKYYTKSVGYKGDYYSYTEDEEQEKGHKRWMKANDFEKVIRVKCPTCSELH